MKEEYHFIRTMITIDNKQQATQMNEWIYDARLFFKPFFSEQTSLKKNWTKNERQIKRSAYT